MTVPPSVAALVASLRLTGLSESAAVVLALKLRRETQGDD